MSIWDDPDLRSGGDYVKFENVGDGVTGEITGITFHIFEDGKKVPKIYIRTADGDERTLTAGQVQLKSKLAELRPNEGDQITVKLARVEKRPGGKTLKHFDVAIKAPSGGVAADSLI
jgi:hypothetical protein